MRHSGRLELVQVAKQGAGCAYRGGIGAFDPEGFERVHREMSGEVVTSELGVELPSVALVHHRSFLTERSLHEMSQSLTARKDQFAWSEPGQYRFQIAKVARCQLELSRREVRSRDANRITHLSQCAEEVVSCPVEQIVGKRRARSDGLDHFPSDKPLGELRIFRLLADRHPKSLLNQ